MKNKFKLTATILAIVFTFLSLPLHSLAFDFPDKSKLLAVDDVPVLLDYDEAISKGHVARLREEEETLNVAIFENEDTTKSMYLFTEPIKYVDSTGAVKDKCTELVYSERGFANISNDVHVLFYEDANNGVLIETDYLNLTFIPDFFVNAAPHGLVLEYPNMESSIAGVSYIPQSTNSLSISYYQELNGYRNSIVVPNDSFSSISFTVNTNGKYISEQDEVLYLFDEENETVGRISSVLISDATGLQVEGKYSYCEIVPNEEYRLTLDFVDINFSGLSYPLTVNSSITIGQGITAAIVDATIYDNYSTNFGTWHSLFVGNFDAWYNGNPNNYRGIARTLIRFPYLIENTQYNEYVDDGYLISVKYNFCEINGSGDTIDMFAYMNNTLSWVESSVVYSSTAWNYSAANYIGSSIVTPVPNQTTPYARHELDITRAALFWKNRYDAETTTAGKNYVKKTSSLLLKAENESSAAIVLGASEIGDSVGLTSSKPYVVVNYASNRHDLIYKIKNNGTQKYLNVGNSVGTNGYDENVMVSVATYDDSANAQEFRLDYSSTEGGYRIKPICSRFGRFRTLDVIRQNSQLVSGCMVEIYTPVDPGAQLFRIDYINDGCYKICMVNNPSLALTASNTGAVTISTYTASNYQKWSFIRTETSYKENYYSLMNVVYPAASTNNYIISSGFEYRFFDNSFHCGIDLPNSSGTALYPLFNGIVVKKGFEAGGAGNYIIVEAIQDKYNVYGSAIKLRFVYMHMQSPSPFVENSNVYANNITAPIFHPSTIGCVGSTGGSEGPHLHLGIIIDGSFTMGNKNHMMNPQLLFKSIPFSCTT